MCVVLGQEKGRKGGKEGGREGGKKEGRKKGRKEGKEGKPNCKNILTGIMTKITFFSHSNRTFFIHIFPLNSFFPIYPLQLFKCNIE